MLLIYILVASIIHSDPSPLLATLTMSHTNPPASGSPSSNLKDIFDAALTAYEQKTQKSLRTHPLMDQLKACSPQPPAPDQVFILLRAQVGRFEKSADDKLISRLGPIVTVLCVSSPVTSAVVGLVNHIRIILLLRSKLSYHISRLSHPPVSFLLVPVSSFR